MSLEKKFNKTYRKLGVRAPECQLSGCITRPSCFPFWTSVFWALKWRVWINCLPESFHFYYYQQNSSHQIYNLHLFWVFGKVRFKTTNWISAATIWRVTPSCPPDSPSCPPLFAVAVVSGLGQWQFSKILGQKNHHKCSLVPFTGFPWLLRRQIKCPLATVTIILLLCLILSEVAVMLSSRLQSR